MYRGYKDLEELWGLVDELNERYFPGNLRPILGNGRTVRPKVMFVFINPTSANSSSHRNWKGPRFPFIGTKPLWRVFHRAGMFDEYLINHINQSKSWSLEFTDQVLQFIRSKSFYLTNIVKWTGSDASLPSSEKIRLFLPILQREIEIVQPRYIVTFGLLPFENMTNQKIRLADYYEEIKRGKLRFFDYDGFQTLIPCYFPVGRGNPKRAVEILRLVNRLP